MKTKKIEALKHLLTPKGLFVDRFFIFNHKEPYRVMPNGKERDMSIIMQTKESIDFFIDVFSKAE
jgi:hypothetical protein